MSHFTAGDVLVGAQDSSGTRLILHRDADGVAIDTHPLPAGVDFIPLCIVALGGRISICGDQLGDQCVVLVRNDAWDALANFYTDDIPFPFGGAFGSMVFDTTGQLFIAREAFPPPTFASRVDDIIQVSPSGVFVAEHLPSTMNGRTASVQFVGPDFCRLFHTSGDATVRSFDICADADGADLYDATDGMFSYQLFGIATDAIAGLLYVAVVSVDGAIYEIRAIAVADGSVVHTYDLRATFVSPVANCLALSEDRTRLYVVGSDRRGNVAVNNGYRKLLIIDVASGGITTALLSDALGSTGSTNCVAVVTSGATRTTPLIITNLITNY